MMHCRLVFKQDKVYIRMFRDGHLLRDTDLELTREQIDLLCRNSHELPVELQVGDPWCDNLIIDECRKPKPMIF